MRPNMVGTGVGCVVFGEWRHSLGMQVTVVQIVMLSTLSSADRTLNEPWSPAS